MAYLTDRALLHCTEPGQSEGWRQAFILGFIQGYIEATADLTDQ
jgi:hypothetical protein